MSDCLLLGGWLRAAAHSSTDSCTVIFQGPRHGCMNRMHRCWLQEAPAMQAREDVSSTVALRAHGLENALGMFRVSNGSKFQTRQKKKHNMNVVHPWQHRCSSRSVAVNPAAS